MLGVYRTTQFDARVNAHIRDPKTLFVSGLFATLPTLVVGAISGGLVWWWFGKSYVVVTSLTFGLLAGLVAFGFVFYSIVLNAPWHSGYVKPGAQSPNGKENKLAKRGTFSGLPPSGEKGTGVVSRKNRRYNWGFRITGVV